MKVIIAGSRDITDYNVVCNAVNASSFSVQQVVSGGARGVDTLALQYARDNGLFSIVFPANWDEHGRGAGHMRNQEMADYSDALIAVWDGESKGTKDMIERMRKAGKPTYIHLTKQSLDDL